MASTSVTTRQQKKDMPETAKKVDPTEELLKRLDQLESGINNRLDALEKKLFKDFSDKLEEEKKERCEQVEALKEENEQLTSIVRKLSDEQDGRDRIMRKMNDMLTTTQRQVITNEQYGRRKTIKIKMSSIHTEYIRRPHLDRSSSSSILSISRPG